jgi:predicted DNA-binding transcriptional regulator AlpA
MSSYSDDDYLRLLAKYNGANKRLVASAPDPRGLRLEIAAAYVGIGRTKFQEMVLDGRMPRPRRINARLVWDKRELDVAFDDLPIDGEAQGGWRHGDDA